MDIQLIQVDPKTRVVTLGMKPVAITGISKLIQVVVLSLLDVPGRDALDPEKGGGLPSLVGSNVDPNDSTEVFADIAQRVRKSETEILTAQIGLDLNPEEKLREIQIIALSNGEQLDQIFVTLRVVNEAGQATDVVM